jgi:hypothetical protein
MKITSFTTSEARKEAQLLIQAKLDELTALTGLKITLEGGGTYDNDGLYKKITIRLADGKSDIDRAKSEWTRYALMLDLPTDGFGKIINIQGKRFEIVGVNPKKPKNCVSIKDLGTGKVFITSSRTVNSALSRASKLA